MSAPTEAPSSAASTPVAPMGEAFSRLRAALEALKGQGPVYYLPNPGNWGDALIRQGTLKLFRDMALDFVELPVRGWLHWLKPRVRRGVLVYGGGGAWCKLWSHSEDILAYRGRLFDRVLVMPSTYERTFKRAETTFFARDRFESLQAMPEATFCHDLAFYLGKQSGPRGVGVGNFFRTDAESAGKLPIPPGNFDVSAQGDHLATADGFFEAVSKYEVIRTDRLHVGITACLLGKELHLYPGGYFKNQALYRSSMEGYFENVHLESLAL